MSIVQSLKRLWKDDEGATAVEYGLIIAGIAAVIIGIVFALGGTVETKFNEVNTGMQGGGGGGSP